jgi:hypothetical protein
LIKLYKRRAGGIIGKRYRNLRDELPRLALETVVDMGNLPTVLRTRRCDPQYLGPSSSLAAGRHTQLGQDLGDMTVDGTH